MSSLSRRALLTMASLVVTRSASASAPTSASPGAPGGSADFARLRAARATLRSLQGRFTQTRTLRLFRHDVVSHGRFALRGATHLLWAYDAPEATSYVWTPRTMAVRARGEAVRTMESRPDVARQIAPMRLALTGGLDELERDFALALRADEGGGFTLSARARASAIRPQEIVVTLDPTLTRPSCVTLRAGARDVVVVTFEELRLNEPIDDRVFAL